MEGSRRDYKICGSVVVPPNASASIPSRTLAGFASDMAFGVLATQTPLTRVLPAPHAATTCVTMLSGS
jgi:hypothetical protein